MKVDNYYIFNDYYIFVCGAILLAALWFLWQAVKIVPQQQVWIIERLGKYSLDIRSGIHFIIPILDKVAYKHNLKESAINIAKQSAITKDNVTLVIDGILYVKIINPVDASYGVEDPYYAISQLAQTSMRSAIGKITLDNTFEERESLNMHIVNSINEAATHWGIQCMRYEIKDISPPTSVLKAMEMQVAADRQKRADILSSEGKQQSMVNLSTAKKQELILQSEGLMQEKINNARGQAEAIKEVATATAHGIESIAKAIQTKGGEDAVSLKIAEQYVDAFKQFAKSSNTVIVPANTSDASSMITQAISIFDSLKKKS